MGHWNSSCDQKILFILSLDLSVARFVSVRLSFDFRVGAFSFSVALALTRRFPFEGVRIRAVPVNPSPETQVPLMELDAL
jgi:hypothetical protein